MEGFDTTATPSGEGRWTLLQQRMNGALWQWDRPMLAGPSRITRYVITRTPSRLDFDNYDEAENMFRQMELSAAPPSARPRIPLYQRAPYDHVTSPLRAKPRTENS